MVCFRRRDIEERGLKDETHYIQALSGLATIGFKACLYALSLLLALACFSAQAQTGDVPTEVRQALRQAGIPLGNIGIAVRQLGSDKPLLMYGERRSLNPASVIKMLTTLVGLDMLGPAYTWKTRVLADTEIHDGVLYGNLYLKGSGDPKLDLPRFWLLLRQLRTLGLREIHGDLVLDNREFQFEQDSPQLFDGEGLAAYNAQPDALLLNFNLIEAWLIPQQGQVSVVIEPSGAARVRNELTAVDAPCNGWRSRITATLAPETGVEHTVVFTGEYPLQCGIRTYYLNWLDSRGMMETWFRPLWAELGGTLTGRVIQGKTPENIRLLTEISSPPLAEIVRDINKFSNNIMARQLYLALGSEKLGPPAYPDKSWRAIKLWLKEKNIAIPELSMENGAGLSRLTRISAASLLKLLLMTGETFYFAEYEASLPIAGVDGTMQERLKDSPACGHARIKTGTLQDTKAAAGYVVDRRGRKWAMVFLINHANAEKGQAAQDALIDWLARRD
jgi:serine-type D-Ala-D-Ala carboxypeptidase/endopeptidase (penicillin-binding protein 4)